MTKKYELKEALSDIRFDEIIVIFGFQQGEYLEELNSYICEKNKIYIIEPNESEYEKYKQNIKYKNIILISLNDENIDNIMSSIINKKSFLNMSIQIYGEYDILYEKEYNQFKELIDKNYYKCSVYTITNDTFKSIIFKNIISNIHQLNNSYKFDSYISTNENVPALIVSAGPSLDKNLQTMIENREKLNDFFIIAGNRTLEPLLKNGIKPDAVVSIDPQEVTYEMMKNYLNSQVPFIYCEKSNSRLVKEYQGIKIAISQGILNNINKLKDMTICMSGGSIVHVATDIAFLLGCNPIIFLGQDFGYTDKKDHALVAKNKKDKEIDEENSIIIKDINDDDMYTSELLKLYKNNLEDMLTIYRLSNKNLEFKNASYGATIKYARHEDLIDILNYDYNTTKVGLEKNNSKLEVESSVIIKNIKEYLDKTNKNIKESEEICNEIIQNPIPKNIVKFSFVLRCIDDFIKDKNSIYIENYIATFLVYIKEKLFIMKANEYERLSRDVIYQCNIFKQYMIELDKFLKEIKNIINLC